MVGRKNYYGSGAMWSARLTAVMLSIFSSEERELVGRLVEEDTSAGRTHISREGLPLVVNNNRFLTLPWVNAKNLVSKRSHSPEVAGWNRRDARGIAQRRRVGTKAGNRCPTTVYISPKIVPVLVEKPHASQR